MTDPLALREVAACNGLIRVSAHEGHDIVGRRGKCHAGGLTVPDHRRLDPHYSGAVARLGDVFMCVPFAKRPDGMGIPMIRASHLRHA